MDMDWLEHRVPPPLVATLFGVLMWLLSRPGPGPEGVTPWWLAGAAVALLLGLAVCLAGVVSFRLARTTVNPLKPESASALVSSGVYRYTRNPMYLGFALVLAAWALYLAAPLALLGVIGFVMYMNRFQIGPEERALEGLFGEDFAAYRARVRRWL